ncbi:helix-turn-helix domain-containing protein [Mesorhizobium sp. WSM2239]|uniref:Helix-turn-helix domain-containing protein n=2 Tax=unclassified Mesorhizobium TaxID=325217 RepID=A0AAU8DE90_9HYPH
MAAWVSARQLASELLVSDRTIRYWAARGMIPGAVRIGRQFRFRLTDVEDWLNKKGVPQKQGDTFEWPKFTFGNDQPSIKPASKLAAKPLEDQLDITVQRLLKKRQMRSKSA